MAVNVAALVGMIVFYILILVVGILSSRKRKSNMEETILADRGLGVIICTFTLTATWIGGAEINGTAEAIYTPGVGLVWTLAPWCYSLSLALGGLTVAKTLRRRRYVTMIDPYQARYGENMGVLLLLLHVTADLFFAAATLLALGTTVSVVIGLDLRLSTIVSEVVVVVYTLFGGIRSVAYTDIVQLPCILLGLCLSIPFAVKHPAVSDITNNTSSWLGEWPTEMTARWIDDSLMLIVGAVPVSIYLQRVLAARTPTVAQVSSVLACFGAIILTIPAVIIGAIGNKTDWAKTSYFIAPTLNGTNNTITPSIQPSLVLPLVIQYLTPTWVSVIGLGAVAAAVMSSCDSVLVAVSSEIAYNVYKPLFRKKASDREIVWVTRVTVVVSAIISTAIALSVGSIYWLLFLLAEVQYAVMVPQFYCAVFFKKANTYGSFIAIIVGLVLRIGGGDPILEIPVFIKYPYYSDVYGQRFPFKLLCMLSSLASLVLVSYLTRWLFLSRVLPRSADIFRCYRKSSNKEDSQITHDTKL